MTFRELGRAAAAPLRRLAPGADRPVPPPADTALPAASPAGSVPPGTGELAPSRPAVTPHAHGVIALRAENCTSCMICVRECPDWCIELEAHQEVVTPEGHQPGRAGRTRTVNVLDAFRIDYGLCMYCGICVEVCPHDALFWSPEHEHAAGDPAGLVHDQERLGTWLRSVPPGRDTGEGDR